MQATRGSSRRRDRDERGWRSVPVTTCVAVDSCRDWLAALRRLRVPHLERAGLPSHARDQCERSAQCVTGGQLRRRTDFHGGEHAALAAGELVERGQLSTTPAKVPRDGVFPAAAVGDSGGVAIVLGRVAASYGGCAAVVALGHVRNNVKL